MSMRHNYWCKNMVNAVMYLSFYLNNKLFFLTELLVYDAQLWAQVRKHQSIGIFHVSEDREHKIRMHKYNRMKIKRNDFLKWLLLFSGHAKPILAIFRSLDLSCWLMKNFVCATCAHGSRQARTVIASWMEHIRSQGSGTAPVLNGTSAHGTSWGPGCPTTLQARPRLVVGHRNKQNWGNKGAGNRKEMKCFWCWWNRDGFFSVFLSVSLWNTVIKLQFLTKAKQEPRAFGWLYLFMCVWPDGVCGGGEWYPPGKDSISWRRCWWLIMMFAR